MWMHQAGETGFRSGFPSLESGTLISCLFQRNWSEALGREGKQQLSLTLFFSWKSWKVSISSQYGMENCSSIWTYSGNGNKLFPTYFTHGSSFFLFKAIDFILWTLKSKHLWAVSPTVDVYCCAHVSVRMEDIYLIKSIPLLFFFTIFLWPSPHTDHLGEGKKVESLS